MLLSVNKYQHGAKQALSLCFRGTFCPFKSAFRVPSAPLRVDLWLEYVLDAGQRHEMMAGSKTNSHQAPNARKKWLALLNSWLIMF